MNNLEIAEWAANHYIYYKKAHPNKQESEIVKYMLTTRYKFVNISEEFDELATFNLPSINTFFDLIICLLNIELKEGRTKDLDYLIYSSYIHLKKNGYLNKIQSEDLQLINNCIQNILQYLEKNINDKELYPITAVQNKFPAL